MRAGTIYFFSLITVSLVPAQYKAEALQVMHLAQLLTGRAGCQPRTLRSKAHAISIIL